MKPVLSFVLGGNTRLKVTSLGMLLVTLFAWRCGWKPDLFSTFCTAITSLAVSFIGPHTWESVKKPQQEAEPK